MAKDKHYVERDGKIYARFYYTDSEGKLREKWKKCETKTDAKNWVKDQQQIARHGTESFEQKGDLNEYLDKWLDTQKHKVAERTYQDYKNYLRLHVRPVLGKKKLSTLRPLDIQGMVDKMKEKDLAPRTIQQAHEILKRALNQAVDWEILLKNPSRKTKLPKQVRTEMKSLTPEQARVFLDACEENRFGLMFHLALLSGCRPEEYLALQWTDLDFQKCTITIQRVIVWIRWKKGWYFAEPKTPKSRRTIPLPAYLMQKFSEYRRSQLEYLMKHRDKYTNEHNLVFMSEVGTPVSLRNLERRHFKPLLVSAGLPDIRLYDLRHSCATLLLAAGENPKVVSERLGHSTIVLTLDCYSHVLPTMQQAATDRLEGILKR